MSWFKKFHKKSSVSTKNANQNVAYKERFESYKDTIRETKDKYKSYHHNKTDIAKTLLEIVIEFLNYRESIRNIETKKKAQQQ